MKKAVEGAIYCTDCAGKLPRRTPLPLVLKFPASSPKSTCHGAKVEWAYLPHVDEAFLRCTQCRTPCEVEEEKGTCWECGKEIMLHAAHKVVKREKK